MLYADGQKVQVGDRVEAWPGGPKGIVLFIVDTGEYAPGYSAKEWDYLEHGFMVEEEGAGLVFYTKTDEDYRLIARKDGA
jgi:hypothetical protein